MSIHSSLHYLGILLVQGVGACLECMLLEVNLADQLIVACPFKGGPVVVGHQLIAGTLWVLVSWVIQLVPVLVHLGIPTRRICYVETVESVGTVE